MKRMGIAAAAAALAMVLLAGCGTPGQGPAVSSPAGTTGGSQTDAPTKAPTQAPTEPPGQLNIFTGKRDLAPNDPTRPVGIMIGNNDRSRPQVGLEKADMYVEAETEGGITRIMAVFANAARVPDKLGPVRSARSPFVQLGEALDLVYCHAGGSPGGLKTIANANINNINALVYDGSTFWRDADLRRTKGLEYSMMTSGQNLTKRIGSLKYRTTSSRTSPFAFGGSTAGNPGTKLQVYFSGGQTDSFVYNDADKLYYKNNGSLSGGSPHKTASGVQLSAANVIVMFAPRFVESSGATTVYNFTLNSGTGKVASGGLARDIRWSRTASSLQFTESDGSPLALNPGKTYICLVHSGYADKTIVS